MKFYLMHHKIQNFLWRVTLENPFAPWYSLSTERWYQWPGKTRGCFRMKDPYSRLSKNTSDNIELNLTWDGIWKTEGFQWKWKDESAANYKKARLINDVRYQEFREMTPDRTVFSSRSGVISFAVTPERVLFLCPPEVLLLLSCILFVSVLK